MGKIYGALILLSAATLAFQVALTRFFSLAQGHHFAFMAISLALLGIGASGTYLSLRSAGRVAWQRTFLGATGLFVVSLPAAYLAINYLPFDAYRIAWEPVQLLWLGLYYLALAVPFFFSGLVVGVALVAHPGRAGPIYAANLLGAGVGSPLALLALANFGGPGTVFFCTLLGWLAVAGYQMWGRQSIAHRLTLLAGHLSIIFVLFYLALHPPALFSVQLTPYKALSQAQLYPGSDLIFSQWNAFSRVDLLRSEGIRSAPGLSFAYAGQIPPQLGLLVDGDNLSPITRPTPATFTQHLPVALPFLLRSNADVLILEPGGGLAVLAALQNGARSVTVVHSNPTVVEVIRTEFAGFSGKLYTDPRVSVVIDEPRSFLRRNVRRNLRRTGQQFDLIILPLTDSFRPVTAGAYTLSEDYRYTVEAFIDGLSHLSPDGLLVAERWLQLPPSESLRLWGTMVEALRRSSGQGSAAMRPQEHLAVLRSLQTSLIMAGPSPLVAQDIAGIRQFASTRQFDLVWLPGLQANEANRYSVVPDSIYYQTFTRLLDTVAPDQFYSTYPHAVAPPTDDHPFFFHFFKWQQTPEIVQSLGRAWQPFGGSGYLVLVLLLALVLGLSITLILLPLLWQQKSDPPSGAAAQTVPAGLRLRYLLYFTGLGLGFLFVEIPLLQRFILYLGQPTYSFAVVVSTLLVAAGAGSGYLSGRVSLKVALPAIVTLTIIYPLWLPHLFTATLNLPFLGRVGVTILALFPLGALLGVPFPRGLALVSKTAPQLTPWVWAVNGCASVVSAVLAPMLALTWSFSVVLWSAALAYGLAWLVLRPTPAPNLAESPN